MFNGDVCSKVHAYSLYPRFGGDICGKAFDRDNCDTILTAVFLPRNYPKDLDQKVRQKVMPKTSNCNTLGSTICYYAIYTKDFSSINYTKDFTCGLSTIDFIKATYTKDLIINDFQRKPIYYQRYFAGSEQIFRLTTINDYPLLFLLIG